MESQQLLGLMTFALVSTVSPGPNNIMLMTSGANVGFIRTIPHMLGVVLGFSVMVALIGIGLMEIFTTYPVAHQILKSACIVYLIYLAMKIAMSRPASNNSLDDYKPLSFLAAANFQWINPKAWSMAFTAVSVYNVSATWHGILLVSLVFAVINIPSVSIWTYAGQQLQVFLSSPSKTKYFNYCMAGLLLASTLLMIV